MRAALFAAALCLAGAGRAAAEDAFPRNGAVTVSGAGHSAAITVATLDAMPQTGVTLAFSAEHGHPPEAFSGPLLWTVLEKAGAIDAAKPRDQVRLVVTVTGQDGYRAVLALAELSPEFSGRQVILADRVDGKPIAAPRLVVPGERRAGRSVRDVVQVSVAAP